MLYAIAYALTLVIFAALDIAWLMTMGAKLYKQTLGPILIDNIRIMPALAFYLMYPAGLVVFAIAPGLKGGSASTALVYGALFGLFAYGTYELTNYATLRDWTLQITIIDIAYGALVSGLVAAIATMLVPVVGRTFGAS
jgi:uncharacterized membrane protein